MGKYDKFLPKEVLNKREVKGFDWLDRSRESPKIFERQFITSYDIDIMGIKETPYDRKLRMLRQLAITCRACTMCELGRKNAIKDDTSRDPHVFSNLNPTRFVVVGQNPGWNELAANEPFVGAAGDNFNKELKVNGLSRDDFYIGNATKCWTKDNAKPSDKHVERCRPFLMMEINLIRPLLVVALGALAFDCLCPNVKFNDGLKRITKSELFDVNVFAVYHPSPLNMASRKEMFQDQMKVLCKLVKALKKKHGLE